VQTIDPSVEVFKNFGRITEIFGLAEFMQKKNS